MSALPPIADIRRCRWDVRKVPGRDITDYVRAERPRLVIAALTIFRAYLAAGQVDSNGGDGGYGGDRYAARDRDPGSESVVAEESPPSQPSPSPREPWEDPDDEE
jgi:hypothetical protein